MRSTIVRVLAAAGVIALLAAIVPVGAAGAATVPKPTAKVDVHQVLAGSQQPFALTVANPLGAGRITSVRVTASVGLLAIAAPVDLAGWTAAVKNGFLTYTAAPGGGIATGSSKVFGFLADAQRPAQDANAAWSVSTSTDTGTVSKYAAADPAVKGALGTRVRTLELLDVTITAPDELVGDDSLYVTAGQDNITTAVRVSNAASAPQTATVALTDDDGGASTEVVTIGAGEIATVPLALLVGATAGHGKAVASAVAGESVAATRFRAYVAQPALELAAENLRPWEVAPGTDVTFAARVATVGSGGPALTIDPSGSAFVLASGAITAPLADAATFGADDCCAIVESERTTIPDVPDGQHAGDHLHLEGIDANGAERAIDVPFDDPLLVDSQAPTGEIELTVDGPAAGNDDQLSLGGTLLDHGDACSFCQVGDTWLEVLGVDGTVIDTIPVYEGGEDDTLLLKHQGWQRNGAELSGFWQTEWPEDAVAARWVLSVTDASGVVGEPSSALIDVDVQPPVVSAAIATDVRAVSVYLSEPVTAPLGDEFAPGDWACDGAAVQRASLSGIGDIVDLALSADLDRNATPTCAYDPQAAPATDRMGYELAPTSVVAADHIAPLEPAIDAVDGRGKDSGAFFASTSTPTLSISQVHAGDAIRVFEILPDHTYALIASGTASGPTIQLTTSSLGSIDRTLDLFAQATDPAGSPSDWSSVSLVLDFTAPTLASATITHAAGTRDVTVTFAEPLVGPAAANDWAVYNGTQAYTVSVQVSGGTVTLTVSDARYQPLTMSLNGVAYDVLATDGSTRLTDRAGNVLADSSRTF